jgi:hypothetical protein
MAVFAPIPRASESTATAMKPGALRIWRRAKAASLTEGSRKRMGQGDGRALIGNYTSRKAGEGVLKLSSSLDLEGKRLAEIDALRSRMSVIY